ncbi:hypothetical protein BGZ93_011270 [Podila epicladia]|nr:hypothetical protein BGZ92_011600 [Podila epicladia]KAG0098518.1 hypothetical protein BGZ93_011270 [Podila epicladia]
MAGLRSLDSGSTLTALTPCTKSPSSPSPTSPDSIFTEHFKRSPESPSSEDKALSKVVLSFFLSPAGYNLLRLDHSAKRTKNKDTRANQSTDEPVTKSSTMLQKSLMDPDEYTEWFKNNIQAESNLSYPILSTHPNDLPSASRAALRGFMLAFMAGTAIDVVLPAVFKQKFKGIFRKILTNSSALSLGASVGSFAFLYRILFRQLTVLLQQTKRSKPLAQNTSRIDSGIGFQHMADLDGQEATAKNINRQKWITAMVAAMLASPAFTLIPQKSRQLTLALYFLTYAGEVIYAALEHKGYTAWMPHWLGVWVLFPISSSQTIHTFVHHGDCFPNAFRKLIQGQCSPFLVRPKEFDPVAAGGSYPNTTDLFTGITNYMQSGYNSVPTLGGSSPMSAVVAGASQFLVPQSCLPSLNFTEGMGHRTAMCRLFHPHSASCSASMATLAKSNMKWALKLYSTLAVLTFLVKGGNVFKHGVINYFTRTGMATVRSAVCTWGMVMTAFPLICVLDRYLPTKFLPTKRTYLNGFLGGLWILVESQQRQSALTLYYTRFMLEGMWRRLVKAGYATNIRHGETLLFGMSMSVIMAIFETLPTLQRKSFIETALRKIFRD